MRQLVCVCVCVFIYIMCVCVCLHIYQVCVSINVCRQCVVREQLVSNEDGFFCLVFVTSMEFVSN